MDGLAPLLVTFVGIIAASLLLQSLAFVGIYRSLRRLAARIDDVSSDLVKHVDAQSAKVEELLTIIKGMAEGVRTLQEGLSATGAIVQKRIVELDAFIAEVTDVARLQIVRVQDVVDTAARRIEETIDTFHNSVLVPVNEVNAIARGVKVALDVLLRKRKGPSSSTPQDEEMFI